MVNRLSVEFGAISADNIEHVSRFFLVLGKCCASRKFCSCPSQTLTHIAQLRRINGASFPIVYNQTFYKDILNQDGHLNQFAYYKGQIVGAICAALHEDPEGGEQRVYIRTLAVLAAYRGRGVGSQLMDAIIHYCHSNSSVSELYLHVHISNQDAIDFYTQKFDFTQGELVKNYYRRIDPPHCYRLFKIIQNSNATASN